MAYESFGFGPAVLLRAVDADEGGGVIRRGVDAEVAARNAKGAGAHDVFNAASGGPTTGLPCHKIAFAKLAGGSTHGIGSGTNGVGISQGASVGGFGAEQLLGDDPEFAGAFRGDVSRDDFTGTGTGVEDAVGALHSFVGEGASRHVVSAVSTDTLIKLAKFIDDFL